MHSAPTDVINIIIGYLSASRKLTLRTTCKRFRALIPLEENNLTEAIGEIIRYRYKKLYGFITIKGSWHQFHEIIVQYNLKWLDWSDKILDEPTFSEQIEMVNFAIQRGYKGKVIFLIDFYNMFDDLVANNESEIVTYYATNTIPNDNMIETIIENMDSSVVEDVTCGMPIKRNWMLIAKDDTLEYFINKIFKGCPFENVI
jgi:hypothetical protein